MFTLAITIYNDLPYRKKLKFLREFSKIVLSNVNAELYAIGDDYIKIIKNDKYK